VPVIALIKDLIILESFNMNELIKSEAEKYVNLAITQSMDEAFISGFNRCLELAKMDNEEAFENQNGFDKDSWGYEISKESFLAAAKLKDVERMELKKDNDNYEINTFKVMKQRDSLEEKLKVAVETLKWADKFLPNSPIKEALEKIKAP
jgi:hypothetical protein